MICGFVRCLLCCYEFAFWLDLGCVRICCFWTLGLCLFCLAGLSCLWFVVLMVFWVLRTDLIADCLEVGFVVLVDCDCCLLLSCCFIRVVCVV